MHADSPPVRARRFAVAVGALLFATVVVPAGTASAAAGDPTISITSPVQGQQVQNGRALTVQGRATDDVGVTRVSIGVRSTATGQWLHTDGTWGAFAWLPATVAFPNARSTTWTGTWTPRTTGTFVVMAQAFDSGGRIAPSAPWATVTVTGTAPPAPTTTTTRAPTTTTTTRPTTTTTTRAPATTTTTSSGSCGTPPSTFGVGSTTLNLMDASRGRSLPTTVLYPTTSGAPTCGRHPLVIVGHGAAGTGASAADLHRYLVTAGYVVAGPTFPSGSSYTSLAGDVRYVIDQVLSRGAASAAPLGGHIDADHIGYIGTSFGAMVGLSTYQRCCIDSRIDAVVSKIGSAPSGTYDWAAGPPLLMLNGTADTTVTMAEAQATYNQAAAPKAFITLQGVDHSLNVGSTTILAETSLGFFGYHLMAQTSGLTRVTNAVKATSIASITTNW